MNRTQPAAALLAFLASACATVPAAETPAGPARTLAPGEPADCPLTIVFGSYAMGIDRSTLEQVDALLNADTSVVAVERRVWGREGEVTLCARTRTPADAARLFEQVKALFPAAPHGPLTVTTGAGQRFHSGD